MGGKQTDRGTATLLLSPPTPPPTAHFQDYSISHLHTLSVALPMCMISFSHDAPGLVNKYSGFSLVPDFLPSIPIMPVVAFTEE